jgi:hypothetical protein
MAAMHDDHNAQSWQVLSRKSGHSDTCDHTINVTENLWDKGIDLIGFPRREYDPG